MLQLTRGNLALTYHVMGLKKSLLTIDASMMDGHHNARLAAEKRLSKGISICRICIFHDDILIAQFMPGSSSEVIHVREEQSQ